MHITTKATDIELTDELSIYLEKRLRAFEKLLDPNDTSVMCSVEVGRTTRHHEHGAIFRAEVTMHTAGHNFRAEAERETLQNAIDAVQKQILKELRRTKRREQHFFRRGAAKIKNFVRGFSREK